MTYDTLIIEALRTRGPSTTREVMEYICEATGRSLPSTSSISSALKTLERYNMISSTGEIRNWGIRPVTVWRLV